jgi:putative transposase
MASTPRRRRRVLSAALRLRLADAAPRASALAETVYYHFRKWRLDGRLRQAHERLRAAVRESEGRNPDPSGAVIDSQAVKGSGVGGPERGYDGAKRLSGRKRQLLVDTGGLVLLGARVHAASVHDRDGGRRLLDEALAEKLPRLAVVWADAAYTGRFRSWAHDERGWRVEIPSHPDRQLCGATAWRRSRSASRCCRGGGW